MEKWAHEFPESRLIEGLQNGDRECFSIIYNRYWYKLYLIAHRRLRDKAWCEELVQDLFVALWEKRGSLHIEHLENYLHRAMKYKVIDHIRAEITKNNYLEYFKAFVDQEDFVTEHTLAMNDLSNVIEKGLKSLPEKSRTVFRLSRLESWPVSDIAEHLNISEKGVEYHLTKSLKTLRLYLKELATILAIFLSDFH
jgi:RNA polymerase sigma-70 factor (family 1)